ncbi:MAG: sugar-binding protein, partial [Lentisphaeria bacterium]|nr:sugar-binding protein [Lentisphaeria bacterium]
HGVGHLPIWNTEAGYWSDRRTGVRPATAAELLAKAPENLAPNWQTGWPYRPIPEGDAAAFTVRHYYLNVAGGVEKLFWYSSVTSNFPLLCRDSSPRLAALAVASAAEQLAGMEYWQRVDLGLSRLHLHLWRRGDTVKGILWYADRGTKGVRFPALGQGAVADIWGNPVAVAAEGELLLEAGRDPLTITAPAAFFAAAKVDASELVLPVTDSFVVHETSPERPVKNHTSPLHHGPRKVYGLPSAGDALGWRIQGIRPSHYEIFVELRTGEVGNLYGSLRAYELSHRRAGRTEVLELSPVEEDKLLPQPVGTPEGQRRAYGYARVPGSLWLEPGDELVVANRGGFGFVGGLLLRETGRTRRLYNLPALAEAPVLDGELTEGKGLEPWLLNLRRQVAIGVADPFASTAEKDAWGGPEDLSAEFVAGRGPDWIYVGVRVTDPGELHPAAKSAWAGDGLELFLDLRAEDAVGLDAVGPGVYHLFLRAPRPGTAPALEGRFPEGARAVARPADNGWQAEFLIPVDWQGRQAIGLDVAVDDDDTGGGRKVQIVWHGSGDNFQNPSHYGRFQVGPGAK